MGSKVVRSKCLSSAEEVVVAHLECTRIFCCMIVCSCCRKQCHTTQPIFSELLFTGAWVSRLPKGKGSTEKKKFNPKKLNCNFFWALIEPQWWFTQRSIPKRLAQLQKNMEQLIRSVFYKIHTILTDNGILFTKRKCKLWPLWRLSADYPVSIALNRLTKAKKSYG